MNSQKKSKNSKPARSTTSLPLASKKCEIKRNQTAGFTRNTGSGEAQKGTKTNRVIWRVPKSSSTFYTKGVLSRRAEHGEFAYDLSQDEMMFSKKFAGPMKALSSEEKDLQQNSARIVYLDARYEQAPDQKYNFPEATSWRIGWFHKQPQSN